MQDTFYPMETDGVIGGRFGSSRLIDALRRSLKSRAESGKESPHFYALLAGLSDEVQYQLVHESSDGPSSRLLDGALTVDRELLGFKSMMHPQLDGYEVTVKLTATVAIRKR